MMSRKREKPYISRRDPAPSFTPKRRRPLPPPQHSSDEGGGGEDVPSAKPPPATVLVTGLPPDSSILDLKSRFEIYGSISRIRFDRDGLGYITFRSIPAATAAIAASLDPSFGITLHSNRVQVVWANDPIPNKNRGPYSKLVRAEMPLSRHGRSNKLRLGNNGGNSRQGI